MIGPKRPSSRWVATPLEALTPPEFPDPGEVTLSPDGEARRRTPVTGAPDQFRTARSKSQPRPILCGTRSQPI